jgi:Fe-S cluster biogenesis protein NfuA
VELREKIERNLERIRTALQADGGDVELIDVTADGVVKVRLIGACAGCPMSTMTLAFGIERELKKNVPEVKRVEAV